MLEVNDDGTLFIHGTSSAMRGTATSIAIRSSSTRRCSRNFRPKLESPFQRGDQDRLQGSDQGDKPASSESGGGHQVVLRSYGKQKFPVMKVVMEITGLEIKDAKELIENTPITLKQGLDKDEADKIPRRSSTREGWRLSRKRRSDARHARPIGGLGTDGFERLTNPFGGLLATYPKTL